MPTKSLAPAKPTDYLDFELEVSAGSGGQYPAVITRSPAGQARAALRLTFDETALEAFLKEPDQTATAFGEALYASLFVGDIRRLYAESLEQAAQLNKGVRLKLYFQPPELAALPWEYLFSPDLADFLCLSPRTLMVRYQAAPKPRWPLLLKTPLRILGVLATPPGQPAAEGEAEKQKLESSLQELRARGLVNLTWLSGQSWQSLEATLAQSTWNILHIIGHGGFDRERGEDYLVLADNAGEPLNLSAAQLGQALARQASLRLLVMNIYEETQIGHASGLATRLVDLGLPAALVIPNLSQQAAHVFAPRVYEELAKNGPVDIAVKAARDRVRQTGGSIVAWGLPALYMQAPDGLLFNVLNPAETQISERQELAPLPERTELDYLVEQLAEREIQVQEATERLAQIRIDIARLAGEQTERGYQALESTKKLAVLKADVARLAGEQAERERQVEAVTQRLLQLMTESERLTGEQAERERQGAAAKERVAALTVEAERLASARTEGEHQLQAATAWLDKLKAEVGRWKGEQTEAERQAQLSKAALAEVTLHLGRLKAEQTQREHEAQAAVERQAALKVAIGDLETQQAERERQIAESTAQTQSLAAEVERLTQQAAEKTQVSQQETERVEALRAEAGRLTPEIQAKWAQARRRYLMLGAAAGAAVMAIMAIIAAVALRLVH